MALHMARKLASKPGKIPNEKVQLSLPPATLKRLRIAAAELGLDLSEVVADLIDSRIPGVHVRGMNRPGQPPGKPGQGSSDDTAAADGVMDRNNRLGSICEAAHGPVDDAVEELANELGHRPGNRNNRLGI